MNCDIKTTRYDFIDQLKGIAIFFVVVGHVIFFSMNHPKEDLCLNWLSLFHMPLFIFVSGFLVHELPSFKKNLTKSKRFLLPFLLWGILWSLYIGSDIKGLFFETSKYGYWYFVVLTIFYWILWPLNSFFFNKKWKGLLYFSIIWFLFLLGKKHVEPSCDLFSITHCFNLFPFFALGYFLRRYYADSIQSLMGPKSVGGGISVLLFIGLSIYIIINGSFPFCIFIFGLTAIAFFLNICLSNNLSNNKMVRIMEYVGKHTLSIYVLHYFIVRQIHVEDVAEFLLNSDNPLVSLK